MSDPTNPPVQDDQQQVEGAAAEEQANQARQDEAEAAETQPTRQTLGEITPRAPVQFESDELDKRFDEVKAAIENDDLLSPSEKATKLLDLDVKREDRRDKLRGNAQSTEENVRNGHAKKYGVDREVVDSTWNEAVRESVRRRGQFDHGTAMTVFEDRMEAKKGGAKEEPTPLAPKKQAGQTRTEPRGARQAASQPEKKMTVQQIMDRAAMGDTSAIPPEVLAEARR